MEVNHTNVLAHILDLAFDTIEPIRSPIGWAIMLKWTGLAPDGKPVGSFPPIVKAELTAALLVVELRELVC